MKRLILIALIVSVGLSGCGLFKKVQTKREQTKSRVFTDSVYKTVISDSTRIVTIIKVDTVIKTKPVHVIVKNIPADVDKSGDVFAILDTLAFKIKVNYNALKQSFEFDVTKHSELIPLTIDETRSEQRNIKTTNTGQVKTESKTKSDIKAKDSKPSGMVAITILGSFVLIIGAVWLFLKLKSA